uniref:Zinc finger BED domain-containing protein RICESLEEPER 1-like n=1 Tax=Cicer arietinum TaxID=3827 RepID=A0A1S3ED68_CICAR|nr:zinc finger BED domain-containing protein RICESLEEPER 1-like [Cicer arietinum]
MLPPRTKGRKNQSFVWNDFTVDPNLDGTSICNHCSKKLKCDNGTSSMIQHSKGCKKNPNSEFNKRKRTLDAMNVEGHIISSPSVPRFDQEKLRYLLVKMFIGMELPFRQVEHPNFQEFVSGLNPKFNLISRDTWLLWEVERLKLKNYMSQHCQKVCLTANTWTSIQNLSYMYVTAHFVDNNWNLQNKALNRVLTVTFDNASSNDLGIKQLKKRLMSCNNLVFNGEYMHMRCCAHILNIIVSEGLSDLDMSILRLRAAVKYARSSPLRFAKFKACVERSNSEYKGLVCLDVETRWNSTYLMLDSALKHQKAFEVLEIHDLKYSEELLKGKGKCVPTSLDWAKAQSIMPFLKMFYDATLRISGSFYVASNMYMLEVFWNR